MANVNRPLTKQEEIAVVVAAIAQITQKLSPPGPGKPWTIQIADIAQEIGVPEFENRHIGRLVRKMPIVWTRLSVKGRRLVMVPQNAPLEDLILRIEGRGTICEDQIPTDLMLGADDLLVRKAEKEAKLQESLEVDPENFTGIQAELWAQMTPEQQKEYREQKKNPESYYGPRGGM